MRAHRLFAVGGQRERAVHGIPELRQRLLEILPLLGSAVGDGELFFQLQRIVQICADALKLRRPCGERIGLVIVEHVAHG